MTRAEFVQRLILNSMCDDFENVDQVIWPEVAGVAAKCGLTVERGEVVENLQKLMQAGLVKAYDLSATDGDPFSNELHDMPLLDMPEESFTTYFYPTQQGMAFHKCDLSWWPLDGGGRVRFDWKSPE